jgi:ATP-dependent RNA helicase DDX56/DBP9
VSRGIDFQGVSFVINFDFPKTAAAYTHRIGRTARGGASGTALSFVTAFDTAAHSHAVNRPSKVEVKGKAPVALTPNDIAARDHEVLRAVRQQQPRLGTMEGDNILAAIGAGSNATADQSYGLTGDAKIDDEESRMQPAPLNFNMHELESFRYRVEDICRSVTAAAVKEFRTAELKREILNSSKLKAHFAANPNDLKVLRHDKAIMHPIHQKEHLKFVPEYLIPHSMRSVASAGAGRRKKRRRPQSGGGQEGLERRLQQSKKRDPLMGGLADDTGAADGGDADIGGSSAGADADASTGARGGDSGGDRDGGDGDGAEDREERVFTSGEIKGGSLGRSTSGRQQWKLRHKKGKFDTKNAKKNSHRMAGSFIKSKQYK